MPTNKNALTRIVISGRGVPMLFGGMSPMQASQFEAESRESQTIIIA